MAVLTLAPGKGSEGKILNAPPTILRVRVTGRHPYPPLPRGLRAFLLRFTFRINWFVLAQTDGADLPVVDLPAWERSRALAALDITEAPFDLIDGNVMGYAKGR